MLDDIVKGAVEGLISGILNRKASPANGHVEVKNLVLRDDAGRGRAVLGMFNGGPFLTLLDAAEHVKAMFSLDAEAVRLTLWGSDGATQCLLGIDAHGPVLVFSDAKGVMRFFLRLYPNGPNLQLSDDQGKVRAEFDLPDGQPISFRLFDAAGNDVTAPPGPPPLPTDGTG